MTATLGGLLIAHGFAASVLVPTELQNEISAKKPADIFDKKKRWQRIGPNPSRSVRTKDKLRVKTTHSRLGR